jgi:hypothetical protein
MLITSYNKVVLVYLRAEKGIGQIKVIGIVKQIVEKWRV